MIRWTSTPCLKSKSIGRVLPRGRPLKRCAQLMLRLAAALFLFSATAVRADIIIGVAGPMSGQYQAFGQSMLNGVKAAVDKINASGGLHAEQLSIISADDQCDTIKAKEAANKLLAQQVDVVIGHFCSCLLYTSPSPRDRQKS